MRKLVHKC